MTSMERVLKSLSNEEPDRVPLMLLLSHYGAKEAGVSIQDYFSDVNLVVEQQISMQKKYGSDCYYTFQYAAVEVEAYGGDVIYSEETPPNAGDMIIKSTSDIYRMCSKKFQDVPAMARILEITKRLNRFAKGEIPIIGVVMSPFSVPVIQMGFQAYLELIYRDRDAFWDLMNKNIKFCIEWANAQLEAGATAICYFDPLASPSMIEKQTYMKTGNKVAKEVLNAINGPTATHLASGISLPVLEELVDSGTNIIGFSCDENAQRVKENSYGKVSILGNLNGIEMCRWSEAEAVSKVKSLIAFAAEGGGFLLSDTHGEIPYQVPESTLLAISNANKLWGSYPIKIE